MDEEVAVSLYKICSFWGLIYFHNSYYFLYFRNSNVDQKYSQKGVNINLTFWMFFKVFCTPPEKSPLSNRSPGKLPPTALFLSLRTNAVFI